MVSFVIYNYLLITKKINLMKKITFLLTFILSVTFTQALVYNVEVPIGTKSCYIAGEMNGWQQQEMTKVDETHYTIDIAGATETQTYKYCSGPDWKYVEKNADGNDISNRNYTKKDVVAKWADIYTPNSTSNIIIKVKVPTTWATPVKIHFWGDTESKWPGEAMEKNGDWWTYTFPNVANINIVFNDGSNQTTDINNVTTSTCYEIADDKSWKAINCDNQSPTAVSSNLIEELNISATNGKITVLLDGKNDIKLYSVSGQLIASKTVSGNFSHNVDKGIYILNVNNKAYKIIVK